MDRNFDGLSARFKQQIYGTLKGQLRLKMLDLDLEQCLPNLNTRPLNVLDVGGGMGQFSSALAAQGHNITLTDISQEMLDNAKAIYEEVAPNSSPSFICESLQDLPSRLPNEKFDLVLNHAVLEWLVDPKQAVQILSEFLAPEGVLSLMFYNRHAIVWRNLVNGSWQRAHNKHFHHGKNQLMPQNPLDPLEVHNWLTELKLTEISWRGIRCVHDHMPKAMRDQKTLDEFVEIESEIGLKAPYRDLGRYVHMLFKK